MDTAGIRETFHLVWSSDFSPWDRAQRQVLDFIGFEFSQLHRNGWEYLSNKVRTELQYLAVGEREKAAVGTSFTSIHILKALPRCN